MLKNKGCCKLEYAKELNLLGVKQESERYWAESTSLRIGDNLKKSHRLVRHIKSEILGDTFYSAFNSAEIGELFPDMIITFKEKDRWYCVEVDEADEEWWLTYRVMNASDVEEEDTEVDVKAKKLIFLIKHGVIKL